MIQFKTVWELTKQTFSEWSEDKVPRLAAALALYTMLSIAPLLIIAIAVAGFVFGDEAARGQVEQQMQSLVGQQGGQAVQEMIKNAGDQKSGIIATFLGIFLLIFGATGVFSELQDSLNTIWEVKPRPGGGIWGIIRTRFLSFGMVLGIAFLLIVSLAVSALLSGLTGWMSGGWTFIGHALNFILSLGVITLLFAMIYRYLPDVKIQWSDVWIGAAVTAALFTIGKFLIGLYLAKSSVAGVYGAAGSLAILLIWVFYSAQIVFFGAELTQVYAKKYGSDVVPDDNAVAVTDEMRAQQGIPRKQNVKAAADYDDAVRSGTSPAGTRGRKRQAASSRSRFVPILISLLLRQFLRSRQRKKPQLVIRRLLIPAAGEKFYDARKNQYRLA